MVSVIIPSRSPAIGLWATIASCEQQAKPEYVIILSQESTLSHQRLIKNLPKRFHIVGCDLGPAHSRSVGIESSTGDCLFFMDDHVILPPGYFEKMILNLELWPDVVFHVPFTSFPDGPVWYEYDENEQPYNDKPLKAEPYEIFSASHGCFSVKRGTWNKLGYDDRFYDYGGEEIYTGLKARKHGIKVMLDPTLPVFHYSPPVQETPWKLCRFPDEKELNDELR